MEARRTFKDQLGRNLTVNFPPKRIVSLVPSQTEYIVCLGLSEELVGITKFCIHPDSIFKAKTKVGGTKNINPDKIKSLNPDLIICNKEENDKNQIEELARNFPVYVSDVNNLDQAYDMMYQLGKICGREEKASEITGKIKKGLEGIPIQKERPKCIYLIWKNPYMAIGSGNFINSMLEIAGFENILANHRLRYPAITPSEMLALKPELVMLSSEPYPFKQMHVRELKDLFPFSKTILVDGEIFSWYGSRLLLAPDYLGNLKNNL